MRRICRAVKINRAVVLYQSVTRDDETIIEQRIVELATKYGRYGYRTITDMMRNEGISINRKRVYRIWRNLGLKVPKKQAKRGRLYLNDGSCIRLRPEYKNHVWSYDFVIDKLSNGKKIKFLNIIDEYSRVCIASIPKKNSFTSSDIIKELQDLFVIHGIPEHIRSDNGPEFISKDLKQWFTKSGVKTLYIEPGSPWENGYCESFNGKMRNEFLNVELFDTMFEVEVLTKMWVKHYNTLRPHSALGGRP